MRVTGIVKKIISHPVGGKAKLEIQNNSGGFHAFSEGSRYFDDLLMAVCQVTSTEGRLYLSVNYFSNPMSGCAQRDYRNGTMTEFHKHNFAELAYVAEGGLHQDISGKHEVFHAGEICLMGKDSLHAEYLYTADSVVVFLGISNSFFDKSNNIAADNSEAEQFIRNFLIAPREKFRFVRFVPRAKKPTSPVLFSHVLTELSRHQAGSRHLITGYVERLLNVLPLEYSMDVEKHTTPFKDILFSDIQRYINQNYQHVSLSRLGEIFHYNTDYINRYIKKHTGMTYSHFLQHVRLEKAEILLKTTGYPVEEVARQVGYNNTGYFYQIFHRKYNKNPSEMRGGVKQSPYGI
jgi:AraC-like DNA-binding protein